MTNVKRDMTLAEVVQKHPNAAGIMAAHGLHCIGCHVAWTETLEQGASAHGMSDEQIDKMIDEINRSGKKPKK